MSPLMQYHIDQDVFEVVGDFDHYVVPLDKEMRISTIVHKKSAYRLLQKMLNRKVQRAHWLKV